MDLGGKHHFIPLEWVRTIDDKVHIDRSGDRVRGYLAVYAESWGRQSPPLLAQPKQWDLLAGEEKTFRDAENNRLLYVAATRAGAMLTIGTVFQDDIVGRPNYAAPIYGGPFGQMPAIPAYVPPLFIAYAQNDTLASSQVRRFVDALRCSASLERCV